MTTEKRIHAVTADGLENFILNFASKTVWISDKHWVREVTSYDDRYLNEGEFDYEYFDINLAALNEDDISVSYVTGAMIKDINKRFSVIKICRQVFILENMLMDEREPYIKMITVEDFKLKFAGITFSNKNSAENRIPETLTLAEVWLRSENKVVYKGRFFSAA